MPGVTVLPAKLFAVLLVLLVGQSAGYKQELWLYLQDGLEGDALYFAKNQADLSMYKEFLPLVTMACGVGRWRTFGSPNFEDGLLPGLLGSLDKSVPECTKVNGSQIQSFRHYASSDTATDAISLYAGYNYEDEEILVDTQAYAGILHPIVSLTAAGTSNWTLFEGQHLNGKSVCFQVPMEHYNFSWSTSLSIDFNFTTIGSVFRGCDILSIQEYKKVNNMLQ